MLRKHLIVAAAIPALAVAQPNAPDLVVTSFKVDDTRNAQSIVDKVGECLNSDSCLKVIKAIVEAAGQKQGSGNPSSSSSTQGMAAAAAETIVPALSHNIQGEETRTTLTLPAGYVYCHASVNPISAVPAGGDRASHLSVNARPNGIGVYTWVPRSGVGGGNTWMEADFSVVGVRQEVADKYFADGRCKQTTAEREILVCRGRDGGKGLPGCKPTVD